MEAVCDECVDKYVPELAVMIGLAGKPYFQDLPFAL
jgi:hypothetical protein